MLNDLLSIERRLAAHGIAVAERHPDVKDMARGPAFRVRLTSNGTVQSVDLVPDAGRGALWTLRDGQHNGFPGLKTAAGLLDLDARALKAHDLAWQADKSAASRRHRLLRLTAAAPFDAKRNSGWPSNRVAERLESLRTLAGDPQTAAVPAAFERFIQAAASPRSLLEALHAHLLDAVRDRGDEWLEPVRSALIGAAALFIDVPETEFERDAGDPRQIGPVSAALSGDEAAACVDEGAVCALSGKTGALHSGNFPQPNLPGLGQTYIYARNKDIPSLVRYGRTADTSLPIGSDLVRRLSGAIATLTGADKKGRSWRLIPAETGDKPDLLVTSVTEARLADALAGDENDYQVEGWAVWEEFGATVLRQTHGREPGAAPLDEVVILILRTVDPANRKAIYQRKTTSDEVWRAAIRWQQATANVPEWLELLMPVKGMAKAQFKKPSFVDPLSISRLSRTQFANGGQRRVPVIGVSAGDAFGLFLQEGDVERRARKLLRLVLQRHGSLLAGLAATRIKSFDDLKAFDPKADLRRDGLRSVAWIGALLHHLGRFSKRDATMTEPVPYTVDLAFRLGQFLSAADYIHVGYCNDLRGGDVPPTLLGNSVLAIAGADPVRALAILQTRLKPYLAWSKRRAEVFKKAATLENLGKEGKGRAIAIRMAMSHARNANDTAMELQLALAPYRSKAKQMDDWFKAELLLGYMAGYPKKEHASGSGEPVSNDVNGGNGT